MTAHSAGQTAIDEREIAQRRAFLEFSDGDAALLAGLPARIGQELPLVAENVHRHLEQFAPLRDLLADLATLDCLKQTHSAYFDRLAAGECGAEHIASCRRAGAAHQDAGLAPAWHAGTCRKALSELLHALWRRRENDGRFLAEFDALLKAVMFDLGLMLDAHFAAQRERDRLLNRELERRMAECQAQLDTCDNELKAFGYSVSHDLRAPLRSVEGFSRFLLEDYSGQVDEKAQDYLRRLHAAAQRMMHMIDGLLELSRLSRCTPEPEQVDLSALVREIAADLRAIEPARRVEFSIAGGVTAQGDARLLRKVLENLLGNAWKFTSRKPHAAIEFGATPQPDGKTAYFVRDNGAGFDTAQAGRLFGAFQRLHPVQDFPGEGIGLAAAARIVRRHGGRIWAEGESGRGAVFYFTVC